MREALLWQHEENGALVLARPPSLPTGRSGSFGRRGARPNGATSERQRAPSMSKAEAWAERVVMSLDLLVRRRADRSNAGRPVPAIFWANTQPSAGSSIRTAG